MRSRKIRVPAAGVKVRLGSGQGDLLNVSLSGALIRLDQELPVGSTWPLHMCSAKVECRIVRCAKEPALSGAPGPQQWMVAVVYGNLSTEATKLVRELVAEMYQRTGTSRT